MIKAMYNLMILYLIWQAYEMIEGAYAHILQITKILEDHTTQINGLYRAIGNPLRNWKFKDGGK
jgi:hypothetical protein